MANEKTWYMTNTINQACTGTNLEVGQKWMYELFGFLSGGAGQTTSPWIISASSDASTVVSGGTNITSYTDFTFAVTGSAHSWFVATNANILPTKTLYLTVACAVTAAVGAGTDFWMSFDHNAPNFTGAGVNFPPSASTNGTSYHTQYSSASVQYNRLKYSGSATAYFHGVMDETTGSFVAITGHTHATLENYPYSLAAIRLETPRSSSSDPYPILLKNCDSQEAGGYNAWGLNSDYQNASYNKWARYNNLEPEGSNMKFWSGWGMWWNDGTRQLLSSNTANTTTGRWQTMVGMNSGISSEGGLEDINLSGDNIDGTYPALPAFVANYAASTNYNSIRGRLPDIRRAPHEDNLGGACIPGSGTPTACIVGTFFFPVTASLKPGA